MSTSAQADKLEKATFAGGCFWCIEKPFDEVDGVISTISGYANGHTENPTYKDVSRGRTGHTEVLQVTYDPKKVSYEQLLDIFWVNHDPTDEGGQFCDRGHTYRPAIMFHSEEQQKIAEASAKKLGDDGVIKDKIVTSIEKLTSFYDAEDYHQDYYKKNPVRYQYYRWGCGRDKKLEKIWGEKAKKY